MAPATTVSKINSGGGLRVFTLADTHEETFSDETTLEPWDHSEWNNKIKRLQTLYGCDIKITQAM